MRWILHALLNHYRLHPGQLLFLASGVILGSALFVGVQAINNAAWQSYRQGEQVLGRQPSHLIEPAEFGQGIPESVYVQMRLAGFSNVVPLLRARLELAQGESVELWATDPLAWLANSVTPGSSRAPLDIEQYSLSDFLLPPFRIGVPASVAERMGWTESQQPVLANGTQLAPLVIMPDASQAISDIAYAQHLLERRGELSDIALFDATEQQLSQLAELLPDNLLLRPAASEQDLTQLTSSFHLNLTALSMLAFVVGLFLIYNATNYALAQRRLLVARLRALGISSNQLALALGGEMALLLLLFTLPGILLGLGLARLIMPPVAATLSDLFRAPVLADALGAPGLLILTVLMVLFAGLLACGWPLYKLAATSPLWQQRSNVRIKVGLSAKQQALTLGVVLVLGLCAGFTLTVGQSLVGSFMAIALVMLAAALLLPVCLQLLLRGLLAIVPGNMALLRWALAELRSSMPVLQVVMMALMITLAANSGIGGMVNSFRSAVTQWLELRLSSDIYLRALTPGQLTRLETDLVVRSELRGARLIPRFVREDYHPRWQRWQIAALSVHDQQQQVLQLVKQKENAWSRLSDGSGLLINERLHWSHGVQLGELLDVGEGSPLPVVGIYYDYGNLFGQVMLAETAYRARWPNAKPAGYTMFGQDLAQLEQWLRVDIGLTHYQLATAVDLRGRILAVFNRTFAITQALKALTLLVAGVGVLCALAMLERDRSQPLALLCAMGISHRQLVLLGLGQWVLLAALVAMLAIPLGLFLAYLLVARVNLLAFGWSMPLQISIGELAWLPVISIATALLASLWPARRLYKLPVSRLLREER